MILNGINSFDRAGFSIAETKSVLTSLASDCRVEGGDCLNAVEVFWTPSEPMEVLTERDSEYFFIFEYFFVTSFLIGSFFLFVRILIRQPSWTFPN